MNKQMVLLGTLLMLASATLRAQKFSGLALTPPMGWNSWNKFQCDVDETIIRAMADAMATNGMKEAGYRYINIDDCWQGQRDAQGFIQADPLKFPSGIKALADYVHAKGLKLGIYSTNGNVEVWFKPLAKGDWAMCALNRGKAPQTITFDWQKEKVGDRFSKRGANFATQTYYLQNLWTQQLAVTTREPLNAQIPGHDVLMLRLSRSTWHWPGQ